MVVKVTYARNIKTVSNNGWEEYWLDLIPVGCQCNAEKKNKIKKSKGNIYAALSWILYNFYRL